MSDVAEFSSFSHARGEIINNLFDFTYRNGQTLPQKYDSVLHLAITDTSKSLICIFNRITVDTIFFSSVSTTSNI